MDDQVLRSLIKWPNVPDCYGWLALDRRGQWRMRDEYAQIHHLSGSVIEHTLLKDYICKNYAHDSLGRYFFQNGPQKVFVTLATTPWIVRIIPIQNDLQLQNQCGQILKPTGALSDELGNIYITGKFDQSNLLTVALLHDHDLELFSNQSRLQEDACSFRGLWQWKQYELPIDPIHSPELSSRFHFVQSPTA